MPATSPVRRSLVAASAVSRACVVALCMATFANGIAQAPGGPVTGNTHVPVNPLANRYTDGAGLFDDTPKVKLDPKQVEVVNRLRLETMQSETDKVLLLARHLNAEVRRDLPEAARARELAEAAQVEHLAHVVQQLMKASAGN